MLRGKWPKTHGRRQSSRGGLPRRHLRRLSNKQLVAQAEENWRDSTCCRLEFVQSKEVSGPRAVEFSRLITSRQITSKSGHRSSASCKKTWRPGSTEKSSYVLSSLRLVNSTRCTVVLLPRALWEASSHVITGPVGGDRCIWYVTCGLRSCLGARNDCLPDSFCDYDTLVSTIKAALPGNLSLHKAWLEHRSAKC